ncbi:TMAO reductase system periplasmic protein TorT [Duganella sp. FT94W]|uniref:TMAO reductase system periplasmic protein TorT n=1 Tax=Duganella lactea TaxID=2692173 RepID=A0ABW9V1Z0_9BURK|nr:TMAO reductase system periplasmic protein TorT [Duganella lactea]MYM33716.1 TMAO reductase system periplasmic protein TorT [Duganella lactea]
MKTPRFRWLALFGLGLSLVPALAQPPAGFAPIPVQSIFRPLQAQGTADDALASGRVVAGTYGPAPRASKRWRIAFLFPHMKDPYWSGVAYGVISEARRLGVAADILPASGYDDLQGQLKKMDQAIAARYDAIVLSPISMTANNASIAKARAAGITVLELANDSRSDELDLKVTTSLRGMGLEATRWVIRDAQRRGLKSINLALLPGPMGAGWVKGEVDGTRIAAQEAAIEVNILDIRYGDSERGLQSELTARILARHGRRLDYLLGCTGCAPAALAPLKAAGLSDRVRVVAYDLTSDIAHLIRTKAIAAAADTRGVSQARVAINAAVNLLEGRGGERPHTILVKLGMVDQQNLASYPFDSSIAPEGYKAQLSYVPPKE